MSDTETKTAETETESAPVRVPAPGMAVHYYTIDPNEQRVSVRAGPYEAVIVLVAKTADDYEAIEVVPPQHAPYPVMARHKDKAGRDGRWWEWPSA